MTSKSDIIKAILEAALTMEGEKYPEALSIETVNKARPKYHLSRLSGTGERTPNSEDYIATITLEAATEEDLETNITNINKIDSAHPNGYDRVNDGSSGYPYWLNITFLERDYNSQNVYRAFFLIMGRWAI